MTQSTNIQSADAGSKTVNKYFNNINLPPISVAQNIDDAIIAYFEQVADNKESARALASAVVLTSVSEGINPMETLDEFSKFSKGQLNDYLTMFLNLSRVNTSYLGVSNRPTTSKYVARTILP